MCVFFKWSMIFLEHIFMPWKFQTVKLLSVNKEIIWCVCQGARSEQVCGWLSVMLVKLPLSVKVPGPWSWFSDLASYQLLTSQSWVCEVICAEKGRQHFPRSVLWCPVMELEQQSERTWYLRNYVLAFILWWNWGENGEKSRKKCSCCKSLMSNSTAIFEIWFDWSNQLTYQHIHVLIAKSHIPFFFASRKCFLLCYCTPKNLIRVACLNKALVSKPRFTCLPLSVCVCEWLLW